LFIFYELIYKFNNSVIKEESNLMLNNNFWSIWIILLLFYTGIFHSLYSQEEPDSVAAFQASLNAYPFVFYTPETKFAFGGGGILAFYTARDSLLNPSNITVSGYYSTNNSYSLSLRSNFFFSKNRSSGVLNLSFDNIIDRFYGIGSNTLEIENAQYTLGYRGGSLEYQIPPTIAITDRSGFIVEYGNYKILDPEQNPYLLNDSTMIGREGGIVSGLGMVWVWDTRDQVFFPNHGGLTEARFVIYTQDLGSDFTFTRVQINSRKYWSFAKDQVLAVQVYLEAIGGAPPFFKHAALGGAKIMRGYFEGRYRDRDYIATQVEYRQYFWRRFGFVAFAGFGDVARELTALALNNLKPTYGFGLRFLFNEKEKINLRCDIGFGKDTNGVYFGIEEAF
jgi:outer membrane protein assembly factor BamA